jgi:hypothetical protein
MEEPAGRLPFQPGQSLQAPGLRFKVLDHVVVDYFMHRQKYSANIPSAGVIIPFIKIGYARNAGAGDVVTEIVKGNERFPAHLLKEHTHSWHVQRKQRARCISTNHAQAADQSRARDFGEQCRRRPPQMIPRRCLARKVLPGIFVGRPGQRGE